MSFEVAEPRDNLAYVAAYQERGYTRPIPIVRGQKFPPLVKWKPFQSRDPTPEELERWFGNGPRNMALVVPENLAVIDAETHEMLELVFKHCGETPMWSVTPRQGGHAYYRRRRGVDLKNEVKLKGHDVDVRVFGSYCVEQPSVGPGNVPYRWIGDVVPAEELPLLKVTWLRDYAKQRRRMKRLEFAGDQTVDADRMRARARAYVACIEGAIAGQRGHDKTIRVAAILVQKFRLEVAQALPIFLEWNETCEPPWDEKSLLHKLEDAYRLREQG